MVLKLARYLSRDRTEEYVSAAGFARVVQKRANLG
jgi:hypothetical protein